MSCHIATIAPISSQRSREDVERVVNELELSRYAAHVQHREGIAESEALHYVKLFKKSLIMLALNPGVPLWVHKEADEVLHLHMLHPQEYPAFCDKVFGGLLTHKLELPGDELPESKEVTIERTRGLWRELFKEDFDKQGVVWH